MTSLRIKRLVLEDFRCFDALDLALEEDLSVLCAGRQERRLKYRRIDHA